MKIAFFNNHGGIEKTTLVYHVAHMLVEQGRRVLLVDLDPQSNLSAMCLDEDRLEELWPDSPHHPETIFGCVHPLLRGIGDIRAPHLEEPSPGLGLIPGDLALSSFGDMLSTAWLHALDRDEAAFQTLSAFHRIIDLAVLTHGADIALLDVGPGLGAINRAGLLASDAVITPIAPDLLSMHGLRNLGSTLLDWKSNWSERLTRNSTDDLPEGSMTPLGYVVMQAGRRTVQRSVHDIPGEFRRSVLGRNSTRSNTEDDPSCLGVIGHYPSLMPLALDARKPMFQLTPEDGVIEVYESIASTESIESIDTIMADVQRCRADFEHLSARILEQIEGLD